MVDEITPNLINYYERVFHTIKKIRFKVASLFSTLFSVFPLKPNSTKLGKKKI